jgi:hypothetical protein
MSDLNCHLPEYDDNKTKHLSKLLNQLTKRRLHENEIEKESKMMKM